jgi:hypothetical protein
MDGVLRKTEEVSEPVFRRFRGATRRTSEDVSGLRLRRTLPTANVSFSGSTGPEELALDTLGREEFDLVLRVALKLVIGADAEACVVVGSTTGLEGTEGVFPLAVFGDRGSRSFPLPLVENPKMSQIVPSSREAVGSDLPVEKVGAVGLVVTPLSFSTRSWRARRVVLRDGPSMGDAPAIKSYFDLNCVRKSMIYDRAGGGIPTDLLKNSRIILLRNLHHACFVNKEWGGWKGRKGLGWCTYLGVVCNQGCPPFQMKCFADLQRSQGESTYIRGVATPTSRGRCTTNTH